MSTTTLDNFSAAAALLRQRGIAARMEHPGNIFVDLADGSMWGFTNHLNRDDALLEVCFYPDHQAIVGLEPVGDEPPINVNGDTESGERLAAEIAARILAHLAPVALYDREPLLCMTEDCIEALCPKCDDEPYCCICQKEVRS